MAGIFNPQASILSDLSLIFNWIIFFGVITAWILAYRKKNVLHHKMIWGLLIIHFLMILYMFLQMISFLPNLSFSNPIPIFHSIMGTIAFLLVLYTAYRMTFSIPEKFRIQNTLLLMRITAIIWLLLVFSGTFLYLTWYFF
ncbi:MAG: hypothetical protein ACFFFH_08980 [Candidatus Thorarchaeota archaeon]